MTNKLHYSAITFNLSLTLSHKKKTPILTTMRKTILPFFFLYISILTNLSNAQNIGISSTSITPDPSAGLEIRYTNKGLLIPRTSLTSESDAMTIPAPAEGLIVYNTNSSMTGGDGKGFYFNSGSPLSPKWQKLITREKIWISGGNSGTDPNVDFLGTTDNNDLSIITNNQKRFVISINGRLSVLNSSESVLLGQNSGGMMNFSTDRYNTFLGNNSGYENSTGNRNVAVGYGALKGGASGIVQNNNTAIGFLAGRNLENGNSNILIGDSTNTVSSISNGFINIGNLVFGDRYKFRNILISKSQGPNLADSSAILELKSTNQGFLQPRMTIAERNAIVKPADGLMVYQNNAQTDKPKGLYVRDESASAWYAVPQTLFVTKTIDETVASNTTVQTDDEIVISLGTDQTWEISGMLNFFSVSATPDVRFNFSGPAGSNIRVAFLSNRGGANNSSSGIITGGANCVLDLAANTEGVVILSGIISTGATAGQISLLWAQNASNANVVRLKAGSYFKLVRMK